MCHVHVEECHRFFCWHNNGRVNHLGQELRLHCGISETLYELQLQNLCTVDHLHLSLHNDWHVRFTILSKSSVCWLSAVFCLLRWDCGLLGVLLL